MKVYQLKDRFGIDALEVAERPKPVVNDYQVLIRVRAVSLNYRDLLVVKGLYPGKPLPLVPMSEGAGEVVAVGKLVTRFQKGDRVAGIFMQSWIDGAMTAADKGTALGGEIDGMFAEFVALNEAGVVKIPDNLSFEEASTLPCAAVTAWNALFATGNLQPGDTVLTLGTGGVSVFAAQLAQAAGAQVIITSGSDEKLQRAQKELGAKHIINYRATPDWGIRAREITNGRGVDHVIETGGAGTLNQSLEAARTSGTVSMIGVLSGGSAEVNTVNILHHHICVQGIFVGSREMFEQMNRAISANNTKPVIDRAFEFGEAKQAFEMMESAAHFGKIVVKI